MYVNLVLLNHLVSKISVRPSSSSSPEKREAIKNFTKNSAQCAEKILNEIAKAINETFTELKCMLLGLRIYFVQNTRLNNTESTS